MVEYREDLQKICLPFLAEGEAKVLLAGMSSVNVQAGVDLFALEDPADCLYFLVAGRIAVRKTTGFGNRMQVVALLDPGAPVGEAGLLEGQVRGATLTAVTESSLLMLTRTTFATMSAIHPMLALKLMTWLMERISLRLKKSSERLAHVL